jgi:hypothetical protein
MRKNMQPLALELEEFREMIQTNLNYLWKRGSEKQSSWRPYNMATGQGNKLRT